MNPYNSSNPSLYYTFRPTPPLQIVDEIKAMFGEKESSPSQLAIDVGCGSGQMTQILAPHFRKVIGIDSSSSQIEEAKRRNIHSNVTYLTSSVEDVDIENQSVDLVMACEAIHWFDIPKFYQLADKMLRRNGILAVTGYMYPEPLVANRSAQLLLLIKEWFAENRSLWSAQHELLFNLYRDLPSLYEGEKRVDSIPSDTVVTLAHLMGHLRSRSGIQTLLRSNPEKAQSLLDSLQTSLINEIGATDKSPEEIEMTIRFNYFLIMSQKP